MQRTKPREGTESKGGVDGQGEEDILFDCKDRRPPWAHPFPRYVHSHAAGPQELDLKTFRNQTANRKVSRKGNLTASREKRVVISPSPQRCWLRQNK